MLSSIVVRQGQLLVASKEVLICPIGLGYITGRGNRGIIRVTKARYKGSNQDPKGSLLML